MDIAKNRQPVARSVLGRSSTVVRIWYIKWSSVSFTIFNWRVYYLIKNKMNLTTRCWADATNYTKRYWTNVGGGSTNKCKKNIPSIIIISTLAGLTDATPSRSFCNSFALSVFFFTLPSNLARKGGIWISGNLKPRFFV